MKYFKVYSNGIFIELTCRSRVQPQSLGRTPTTIVPLVDADLKKLSKLLNPDNVRKLKHIRIDNVAVILIDDLLILLGGH